MMHPNQSTMIHIPEYIVAPLFHIQYNACHLPYLTVNGQVHVMQDVTYEAQIDVKTWTSPWIPMKMRMVLVTRLL
jgi:hypothetical protein